MEKNIIQILKVGNQELFYSSFLAWLLDKNGKHGLNSQLSAWLLNKIGLSNCEIDTVESEKKIGSIRADIYIVTKDGKRIIMENKTKSIGDINQLEDCRKYADLVIPLGLVKENFSSIPPGSILITYADILECLKSCVVIDQQLTVFTKQFIEYLESMLIPFEAFHLFCANHKTYDNLSASLNSHLFALENNNDKRFFQYVYFLRLKDYISSNVPSLLFGSDTYYDPNKHEVKPHATSWIIEKNMQGPAFMESIIYSQEIPNKIKILEWWNTIFHDEKTKSYDISPRLELFIGANNITTSEEVGVFQIGTWDPNLLNAFNSSKEFTRRGSRNFHQRKLSLEDLKYNNMTSIMIKEMSKIWEFI